MHKIQHETLLHSLITPSAAFKDIHLIQIVSLNLYFASTPSDGFYQSLTIEKQCIIVTCLEH